MSDTPERDAARFLSLFHGADGYYGEGHLTTELRADGKRKVRHGVVKQPLTLERVLQHLSATTPAVLGSYPLVGDRVRFAGIDVDDYRVDLPTLARKVAQLQLPLIVTRSTSGGAHIYVFFTAPALAAPVRHQLELMAAWLGAAAKHEVFPKQDKLTGDDYGNYMALPYHDAARPMRYGYRDDGTAFPTFAEFLDGAEARATTQEAFLAIGPPVVQDAGPQDLLYEAPPCLQTIHQQGGFPDGSKKEGMFSVFVYLRKRFSDDPVSAHMDGYNQAMCNGGGLKAGELLQLEKNSGKKDYGYKCKLPPLNSVCQRTVCLKRKYGISDGMGAGGDVLTVPITHVVKYVSAQPEDPPEWGITFDGNLTMRVSHDTLYYKDKFNLAALGVINRVPVCGPVSAWHGILNQLAEGADVIQLPPDVTPSGVLWDLIEHFLTASRAPSLEHIVNGGVFTDPTTGMFRFQWRDLQTFLTARRVAVKPYEAYHAMKARGGTVDVIKLRKRARRVWSVPTSAIAGAEPTVVTPAVDAGGVL